MLWPGQVWRSNGSLLEWCKCKKINILDLMAVQALITRFKNWCWGRTRVMTSKTTFRLQRLNCLLKVLKTQKIIRKMSWTITLMVLAVRASLNPSRRASKSMSRLIIKVKLIKRGICPRIPRSLPPRQLMVRFTSLTMPSTPRHQWTMRWSPIFVYLVTPKRDTA